MKLIKPSFEIWEQPAGLEGIYKQVEHVGRVCYKSEDKITEDSAKPFVERMIKSGHGAMLEHGTVYLKVPNNVVDEGFQFGTNWSTLCRNPYTRYTSDGDYYYYSTNYRVIVEHGLQGVLEYICEPTEYHERRITVHFVCDRGVSHEFVRHRVFSFAQESTRYCNYSKDKFGSELTFIIPCWTSILEGQSYWHDGIGYRVGADIQNKDFGYIEKSPNYFNFLSPLEESEKCYLRLLNEGWTPQQARSVLPNALKTELVMTGFASDWKHFFDLRAIGTTGAPHPQAKELAVPLLNEFVTRKYF